MSSTFLKLIPLSPDFVPDQPSQSNAEKFLVNIFQDSEVELTETEEIEFIDQGQNFESVSCNLCGSPINMELWQQLMDKAYGNGFRNLTIRTPCCQKESSLNELNYEWPAGFSRFVITISDPSEDLGEDQILKLENIIGTKVRKIWAHY